MKTLINFLTEQLSDSQNIKAFIIIKPEFLKYKNEIFDYISKKGFIMIDQTNPFKLTDNQAKKLYECHKNESWYNDLCKYMVSGKIIAAIYTFDHDKYPNVNTISLMKEIKEHFRNKYGKNEMKNCMHSSDSIKNVIRESKIIF